MKKNVLNEINQMKYLFGYKPGKVISEQEMPENELDEMDYTDHKEDELDEIDFGMTDDFENTMTGDDVDTSMMFDGPDVAPSPTKPDVKPDVTPEKPKTRPGRPNRDPAILPNVDPHPQGKRRRMRDIDMDRPSKRMRDMDETIYEIEIDGDIEELFKK